MKKKPLEHLCIVAFFLATLFTFTATHSLCAAGVSDASPPLPPEPFLPIAELGEYRLAVETAKQKLESGNLIDFYDFTGKYVREKQSETNADHIHFDGKSREFKMALEWMFYFATIAPFIPLEEYVAHSWDSENTHADLNLKYKSGLIEATLKDGKARESAKWHSQLQSGSPYQEILTEAERQLLRIAHLEYCIHNQRKLFDEHGKALREYEIAKEIVGKIASNHRMKKYLEDKQDRLIPFVNGGNKEDKDKMISMASRIVACFHRDGNKVRELVRKTGWSSDLECAMVLDAWLARTRETRLFFYGLPSEKEVKKYRMDLERKRAERQILAAKRNAREEEGQYIWENRYRYILQLLNKRMHKRCLNEATSAKEIEEYKKLIKHGHEEGGNYRESGEADISDATRISHRRIDLRYLVEEESNLLNEMKFPQRADVRKLQEDLLELLRLEKGKIEAEIQSKTLKQGESLKKN